MSYSNIKRFLSVALLIAFTAPSTLALTDYGYSSGQFNNTTMPLSGEVKLTESDDTVTLSLRDSDVKQVLRMFADKAGMNIIFHSSVKGKVTLDLVDTSINEAFNLVLQIAGLNYYKQGKVMIIMDKTDEDNANYSKQEMMVFPVKYVAAGKIADFLNKNVFGMKRPGLSSVEAATVNSATNELIVFGMPSDVAIVEKVIEQFDREPYSKTFTVKHTTPEQMASMICNMLLPSRGVVSGEKGGTSSNIYGGTSTGGAASASGGAGGAGSSLKLGEGIVACSAAGTAASTAVAPFDVQNLSIAYFPQRGTITLMGGSEAQANMIENFIKQNDLKLPQAMLEVSIVELNEQGSKEFQNQWAISSKHWNASFNGSSFSGGRPGGGAWREKTQYVWNDGSTDGAGSQNPETGEYTLPEQIKRIIYLPSSAAVHVTWTMNYLIENRKARVLANPKILITNGQESLIDLTQDYVEKVTSEYLTSASTGGSTSGTVQRNYTIGEDLGIKVSLTPFISPEGYVTLNIKPEYSTVSGEVRTASEVQGMTDLQATLLNRRNLDLKNVRIKDGETLVIGGMIQETEQKTVNKIPFLGDLPIIGSAFRSTSSSKTKNELVIMITPKIINDGEGTVADVL